MKTFKRMLGFIRPHTLYFSLGLVLSLLEIGSYFLMPFIFKIFIDEVLTNRNTKLLYPVILYYLLSIIAAVVFGILKEYIFAVMNEEIVKDARLFLYKRLRNVEAKKFGTFKVGTLLSYFINDTPQMMGKAATDLIELTRNILRAIVGVIVLATINVNMLLALLLLLPAYVFNAAFFNKPIRNSSGRLQEHKSIITETLQEHISGTNDIIVFNKLHWDFQKVKDVFVKYIRIAVHNTMWIRVSGDTGVFIYFLATVLIYLIGGSYVLKGMMTVGTLLFYAHYLDNIYMPSRLIIDINNNLQNAIAIGERYFDFIDSMEDESREKLSPPDRIVEFNDKIVFQNVSFRYNNEYVLKNINLEVRKGEAVAIVGASGSGKSTLIKLLLKLYEPTSGDIYIDTHNLRTIERQTLYSKMSVVFQDPFLFSGTVLDNIGFSKPQAIMDDIMYAANKAGAHDFIQQMELGYHTYLYERGTNVSGGQKQRIAIARSILKDAEIYIFDEATSSLDHVNQGVIRDTILQLKDKGKTIIMITHTSENLANMDKIINIDNGNAQVADSRKNKIDFIKLDMFDKPELKNP